MPYPSLEGADTDWLLFPGDLCALLATHAAMTLHGIQSTEQAAGRKDPGARRLPLTCVGGGRGVTSGRQGRGHWVAMGGALSLHMQVKMPASANKLATSSSSSDADDDEADSSISPTWLLYANANSLPPHLKACKQQLLGGGWWVAQSGRATLFRHKDNIASYAFKANRDCTLTYPLSSAQQQTVNSGKFSICLTRYNSVCVESGVPSSVSRKSVKGSLG